MASVEEFDSLLHDRFGLSRDDLVSALRTLKPQRPGAARLTAAEARLLDASGLSEDPQSYVENAADVASLMGRLYSTAYTPAEVSKGLRVSDSRLRQRRLNHTLWAIDDGGAWVYPSVQFEREDAPDAPDEFTLKHVRGLDRVLPRLLTLNLHPAAIANFLTTPQTELTVDGQTRSAVGWLLGGEPADAVLQLVEMGEWAGS